VRIPCRLVASAVAAMVALAGPAAASQPAEAVGGPRLATTDVVVDADAPELPTGLTAASWLVADLDTGEVLAAKDPHGRYAPASTLKTLTALTLIPVLEADRKVVPSFDDINIEGSKVGLVERVGYPVHELFTALMAVSGNDAANVLASAAGGQEATAALMNDKARSLGAFDTHAVNPHGLDAEGQVSSAYDLALIARAGMADPAFAAYAATMRSSVSAPGSARIEIYTKNKLLKEYEGALGIKNGYTSRARASFIGAAQRDGRRLVVTLMKADPKVWAEAIKLLDWGFAAGKVSPVGELVEPEAPAATEIEGETELAATTPASASGDAADNRLPVTLGGLALAAGAVLAVRHAAPAPAPVRVPAQSRPLPAPARQPARRRAG
jgi:D-alanyl-D-alanine carboxypeptidase (penicillin-binding protein 5/6)